MKAVKRYEADVSCGPSCVGVMQEASDGDYVRFEDYAELLAMYDAVLVNLVSSQSQFVDEWTRQKKAVDEVNAAK